MTLIDAQRLINEAWRLRDTNRKQATTHLDEANQYLVDLEHVDKTKVASAQLQVVLGFFLCRDARFESSIQCLQHALTTLEESESHQWAARAHGTLGIALVFAGIGQGAANSIKRQITLSTMVKDSEQLAIAHQSLGWIYMQRELYTEAIDALQTAVAQHKQLGHQFQAAIGLANLASCYIHLDRAKQAQTALDQALHLCETYGFDLVSTMTSEQNDLPQTQQGVLTRSFGYFDRTLGVVEEMDNNYSVVRALIRSGQIYTDCAGREKALTCLHKALDLAQTLNARELIYTIHLQLANSYETFGEYKEALAHHRQFHQTREAIFLEQSELRIQALQARMNLLAQQDDFGAQLP